MPSVVGIATPSLATFTRSICGRGSPVESSIEDLIALLKRRQIQHPKACAIATALLLRRVVKTFNFTDVGQLIDRVRLVGRRLIAAQPKELTIGNVVRRVLGVIREEAENREREMNGNSDLGTDSRPQTSQGNASAQPDLLESTSSTFTSNPSTQSHGDPLHETAKEASQQPPLLTSQASNAVTPSVPTVTSMSNLLSHPVSRTSSSAATRGSQVSSGERPLLNQDETNPSAAEDFRAEIMGGIEEILEELDQADDQIAGYALEHIHSNEVILTLSPSTTIQRFLLKAAAKRKFTVIYAEGYPDQHEATHAAVVGRFKERPDGESGSEAFTKSLTASGITVILIPDSAVFALMARVNKVLLSAHTVLANGSVVAPAGARAFAKAARMHSTHVVVLGAVYQLSPVYPFFPDAMMENGDPSKVVPYEDGKFIENIEIVNPLYDFVPAELVDLYITNLGGHAPSYHYRIIQDHYRTEDIDLD